MTERIELRHVAAQPRYVRMREPCGADELALAGVDSRAAVQLLDRLLEAAPCSAALMSASDRDRLLASLHRALWSDRIVSTLECAACGAKYDLAFELSTLQRQLHDGMEAVRVVGARAVEDGQGQRFDLPSLDDEEAAAMSGLIAGGRQLGAVIAGSGKVDADRKLEPGQDADNDNDADAQPRADLDALGARLDVLAPLLDVDLDTRCVECGTAHVARFDIQSFVLQRLLDERPSVLGDVHALAGGYGWSLQDIVGLPRSLRRSLVQRVAGRAP